MLQLNPNEIIRINKLINNSLEIIDEEIRYFKKKYCTDSSQLEALNIDNLETMSDKIKNSTLFLNNIINELIEATGESIDNLLNSNHSLSYFETKLISHYADNINNNADKSKLSTIDLCYSKDDKLTNYCQKKNFINYAKTYFKNFHPEEHGLDNDTVINDLLNIYDKKGANEAYAIMHALENNRPDNYQEYHFNPGKQRRANKYYDFNKNTINNYQTNSEIINVNGYEFEIAQVLPKDYSKTEEIAYNYGKANIINTMRTLPDKYLELCSKGDSNIITLTCDRIAMNNNANWSGYYRPTALFDSYNNSITIDIHGSFNDNVFYTQDTLIHEMGHKFDDLIHEKSILDWLVGNTSYTRSDIKWQEAFDKYSNVLNSINAGGYLTYPNVNEFFGDASVAYFKNPHEIKYLCPEVYDLISKMLDGEYGYSYNEKIITILNAAK